MHECAPHVHTSLGRGAGNVTAVMWRDLVEVSESMFLIVPGNAVDSFRKIRWLLLPSLFCPHEDSFGWKAVGVQLFVFSEEP